MKNGEAVPWRPSPSIPHTHSAAIDPYLWCRRLVPIRSVFGDDRSWPARDVEWWRNTTPGRSRERGHPGLWQCLTGRVPVLTDPADRDGYADGRSPRARRPGADPTDTTGGTPRKALPPVRGFLPGWPLPANV